VKVGVMEIGLNTAYSLGLGLGLKPARKLSFPIPTIFSSVHRQRQATSLSAAVCVMF